MLDDERLAIEPQEKVIAKLVHFRTLGRYPLKSAIESDATGVDGIIHELQNAKISERQSRPFIKTNWLNGKEKKERLFLI